MKKKGQGVLEQPYPLDTKAHSDPWNTIEPVPPPAHLGQASNNTHNVACLWLLESPVVILVQDCARDG